MDMTSVNCPFSGVPFTIVRAGKTEQEGEFLAWGEALLAKLDGGTRVSVALDCEGVSLGIAKDSITCVQLAEVYSDNYILGSGSPPPIGPKPGMIVMFPASPNVSDLLSRVLTHKNIAILTFDFTCDVASLLEAGIKIDLRNVVDAQTATQNPPKTIGYIKDVRVSGIRRILDTIEQDEHVLTQDPVVKQVLLHKDRKDVNWDALTFLVHAGHMTMEEFVSKEFLEYAAGDIILTGVMMSYVTLNGLGRACIRNSAEKGREFSAMVKRSGNPCTPSGRRHHAFFRRYGEAKLLASTEESLRADLGNAVKMWKSAWEITILHRADVIKCDNFARFERLERVTHAILTENVEAVRALLNKA